MKHIVFENEWYDFQKEFDSKLGFEKQLRVAKETLMPKRMGSAIGDLFDFSGFAFV